MNPAERRFVTAAETLREPNPWTNNEWLCRPDVVAAEHRRAAERRHLEHVARAQRRRAMGDPRHQHRLARLAEQVAAVVGG